MSGPTDESDAPRRYPANSLYTMSLFARADVVAAAGGGAACGAIGVFLATMVLVVRGEFDHQPVGPHLIALRTYWPGYSVTWLGSFIGAIYGAVTGGAVAFLIALLWNFAHLVMLGATTIRQGWNERG